MRLVAVDSAGERSARGTAEVAEGDCRAAAGARIVLRRSPLYRTEVAPQAPLQEGRLAAISHEDADRSAPTALERGWCLERSEFALEALARLLERLRGLGLPADALTVNSPLMVDLRIVLDNLSKLFAYCCCEEFSIADAEVIWRDGYDGFLRIADEYQASMAASRGRQMVCLRAIHDAVPSAASDVTILNTGNALVCLDCSFGKTPEGGDYQCGRSEEMLAHVREHVGAGHRVPARAFGRLEESRHQEERWRSP